jgi:hypothetical protein
LNEEKANYPIKNYYRDLDRLSFSGEWNFDEKIRGKIIFRDGDKYEGQLSNDLPHEKGAETSSID